MFAIILNLTVITLLGVTIYFAAKVNRKLNLLKHQKQDFAANIKAFNDATEAAIVAVEELHVKGEEVCKLIDEKIRKGEQVGDEIEFFINRATKTVASFKAPTLAAKAPVNSIAEAQLMKALRDREYKDALAH